MSVIGVCVNNYPNFIILELMEGGNLLEFIRGARREGVSVWVTTGLMFAFSYCGCMYVLHVRMYCRYELWMDVHMYVRMCCVFCGHVCTVDVHMYVCVICTVEVLVGCDLYMNMI